MDALPKVVQLRGTIFFQQYIGYTPENVRIYKPLFMPDGNVVGIPQAGVPIQGSNPLAPQFGMPWQLVKNYATNESLKISFLPNKIDIIQEKEGRFGEIDNDFLNLCVEKFKSFKNNNRDFIISRMAFAPLFSIIVNDTVLATDFWQNLLKQTSYKGIPFQNIEYNFLLKKIVRLNNKDIEMNFLHQLSDGFHVTNGQKDADCVLVRLDINTVPEKPYSFETEDMDEFYMKSTEWEKEILDNILC